MEGRPAIIIKSDFCQPEVMPSRVREASAQASDICIVFKQLIKALNRLFNQRVNLFKTTLFGAIFYNFLQPLLGFFQQLGTVPTQRVVALAYNIAGGA